MLADNKMWDDTEMGDNTRMWNYTELGDDNRIWDDTELGDDTECGTTLNWRMTTDCVDDTEL